MGQRPLAGDVVKKIVELLRQDLAYREITARTGASQGAIANVAARNGLLNRPKRSMPESSASSPPAPAAKLGREDDCKQNEWRISLPSTRIHTLDALGRA